MNAAPHLPRSRDHGAPSLPRVAVESFWTLVALSLGVIAFFVVLGGGRVLSTPVAAAALTLLCLWALHARSIRRHPDDVRHDERWRHARERRGF